MNTVELRKARADTIAKGRTIIDKAAKEKRDLTAEEQQEYDRYRGEWESQKAHIDRVEALEAEERALVETAGRKAEPGQPERDLAETRVEKPPDGVEFTIRKRKYRFRAGAPGHSRTTPEYANEYRHYLQTGRVSAEHEERAMSVGDQTQGGYLVPMQMATELLTALDNEVFMRRISTVMPPLTNGVSLGIVSRDARASDATWTAEIPAADLTADTAIRLGAREMMPHLMTKYIEVSQKLLRVSALDAESYVRDELVYVSGITEEQSFLTGDGAQQALGIFTASADGITTTQDVTAASTTTVAADDFKTMKWDFPSQNRNGLSWVCHRDLMEIVDKLKTGDGQYIWREGITVGAPDTILGYPVFTSEYAPNTFTTGLYVAVLGNFTRGYRIVDSLAFEVQRLGELKTLQNKVGFKLSREVDGQPVLADAFRRLKLA